MIIDIGYSAIKSPLASDQWSKFLRINGHLILSKFTGDAQFTIDHSFLHLVV